MYITHRHIKDEFDFLYHWHHDTSVDQIHNCTDEDDIYIQIPKAIFPPKFKWETIDSLYHVVAWVSRKSGFPYPYHYAILSCPTSSRSIYIQCETIILADRVLRQQNHIGRNGIFLIKQFSCQERIKMPTSKFEPILSHCI